jgi:aldose sugar dehydrogenase
MRIGVSTNFYLFNKRPFLLCGILILISTSLLILPLTAEGQTDDDTHPYQADPNDNSRLQEGDLQVVVNDPKLRIETVATGIVFPTQMVFLDSSNDILVAEKNTGTVRRIIGGEVQEEPLIDVPVANNNGTNERGLLGMAVSDQNETTTYVFLYYTESGDGQDGSDAHGIVPAGNRLYRYELVEDDNNGPGRLVNPKLLLDLPARPGPRHNGGVILVTQDENNINKTVSHNMDANNTNNTDHSDNHIPTTILYLQVGDVDHHNYGQALNFEDGPPPDGTGGILVLDIEGNPLPNPVLVAGNNNEDENSGQDIDMLRYYFSYGLRNGFGMDIDPITGYLWGTDNGPMYGDEINLVYPGFNSGWRKIQGLASAPENRDVDIEEDLVDFGGRGKYSDPKFVWQDSVGPTALKFLNSSALGEEYENDMFVGDIHNGIIYRFKLSEDRTELEVAGELADRIPNNESELSSLIFATGFRHISDIEVGPDGYLYILSYAYRGEIMKIVPNLPGTEQ